MLGVFGGVFLSRGERRGRVDLPRGRRHRAEHDEQPNDKRKCAGNRVCQRIRVSRPQEEVSGSYTRRAGAVQTRVASAPQPGNASSRRSSPSVLRWSGVMSSCRARSASRAADWAAAKSFRPSAVATTTFVAPIGRIGLAPHETATLQVVDEGDDLARVEPEKARRVRAARAGRRPQPAPAPNTTAPAGRAERGAALPAASESAFARARRKLRSSVKRRLPQTLVRSRRLARRVPRSAAMTAMLAKRCRAQSLTISMIVRCNGRRSATESVRDDTKESPMALDGKVAIVTGSGPRTRPRVRRRARPSGRSRRRERRGCRRPPRMPSRRSRQPAVAPSRWSPRSAPPRPPSSSSRRRSRTSAASTSSSPTPACCATRCCGR